MSVYLKNNVDPLAPLKAPNFKFERPDWALFRSIDTLCQKAGVPAKLLRRLVLKEIVDNALDAGSKVEIEHVGGVYVIRDFGPGIDGSPEDIARLFSIGRPMVSSKLLRLPSRGALGNGLRVVAGAVLASRGSLRVTTRNKRMVLAPQDDGTTSVISQADELSIGTLIEITFGAELPPDPYALEWAKTSILLARGTTYNGRTSPHWYDASTFHQLLLAAGDLPVRQLIEVFDGCTGARAGEIAAPWKGVACCKLDRAQSDRLLDAAQSNARPVRPERLGAVGPLFADFPGYAIIKTAWGEASKIPFVVEAWAMPLENAVKPHVYFSINRTPIIGQVSAYFEKRKVSLYGCGLAHDRTLSCSGSFMLAVNIITPHCPIVTDGKSPDLLPFFSEICDAVAKAISSARRTTPPPSVDGKSTQKSVVLEHLNAAINKASGNRAFRFSPRQVFYVLRPLVQDTLGAELLYANFEAIITEYESNHGEIDGMYRDPRGTLRHPHLDGSGIALGTVAVDEYSRPSWNFNKVVYIEKEGLFAALVFDNWAERHDAALLTSKGFSTRAVRDLLDKLGDHDEPVKVFCVHDADASGTMIFQTLQEATKARPRRRVEIINLGLEPWEAIQMGLQVEQFKKRDRELPVADYVLKRRDRDWKQWLQTNRVELNAITTPEFIKWMDSKMAEHGEGKVIPPITELKERLDEAIERRVRQRITDDLLERAGIDSLVDAAIEGLVNLEPDDLEPDLRSWLAKHDDEHWSDWITDVADEIAGVENE